MKRQLRVTSNSRSDKHATTIYDQFVNGTVPIKELYC